MVESEGDFSFRKLRPFKYFIIDVMIFVDYEEVLKFMHAVNKESRVFIEKNYISIQNGFINEGLIPYVFDINLSKFYHYQ